jgi:hypothetical protein
MTRKPPYLVRSESISLTLTPSDREFISNEARFRGVRPARLLGDIVEHWIANKPYPRSKELEPEADLGY